MDFAPAGNRRSPRPDKQPIRPTYLGPPPRCAGAQLAPKEQPVSLGRATRFVRIATMRQLTSLDAQFLALESSNQTGHVAGLTILDPSTTRGGDLDYEDIRALMQERLPLLPPLRWRLVEVPLGLDYPYWFDDPDFDLDFHLRELALPPGGAEERLAEQVSRIVARPLDRSRPLWELYLIHGLEHGHKAMLTKIHHSVIDGLSGAEIMGVLFDLAPEGRELEEPAPDGADTHTAATKTAAEPTELEMLTRGLLGVPRYPLRLIRSLPRALPNLDESPVFASIPGTSLVARVADRVANTFSGRGESGVLAHNPMKAPKTRFNGRLSQHRKVAFGQLTLDEVKRVKDEYGCTVNDVVVSICAGAVRSWLLEHDELPDQPLVAQIPVSVRTDEQMGTFGNRIMLMSAPLHTDEPDPVVRLRKTHDSLRAMKERHKALPAELLKDTNHFIPPAVFSRAARATLAFSATGPGRPTWNLVISNVPGPQFPLYCAGARLVATYPVSVITDGMGLNISVMSYCGHMDFGIVADRDQMPDLWSMLDRLEAALEELKESPRSEAGVEA
jgi:diacylglycerol O-acyltransferase / wax synthase